MTDRITLRLGTLAEPLQAAAAKSGRTVSEEIRVRLAKSLKLNAPVMQPGNPDIATHAKEGAHKRWGKKSC